MSERAETCRKNARECERGALLASDTAVRLMYSDLARQWLEMAEQAEDLEHRYGPAGRARRPTGSV